MALVFLALPQSLFDPLLAELLSFPSMFLLRSVADQHAHKRNTRDQTLLGRINCSHRLILGIKRTITQNRQGTLQTATVLAAAGHPSISDECWLMSAAAQKPHSAILGRNARAAAQERSPSAPSRQFSKQGKAALKSRLRASDLAAIPLPKLQWSSEVCSTLQHRQTTVRRRLVVLGPPKRKQQLAHSPGIPSASSARQQLQCPANRPGLSLSGRSAPRLPSSPALHAHSLLATLLQRLERGTGAPSTRAPRPSVLAQAFQKSTFPPASALFLFNYSSMLYHFHSFPRTRSDQSLTQPVCFSGLQETRNIERGTVPSVVTVTVRQRLQFTRPPRVHCISGT
ncbi:hypothetical protein BGZ60DRAFT_511816, partial [Tricladium varicosporioides]